MSMCSDQIWSAAVTSFLRVNSSTLVGRTLFQEGKFCHGLFSSPNLVFTSADLTTLSGPEKTFAILPRGQDSHEVP